MLPSSSITFNRFPQKSWELQSNQFKSCQSSKNLYLVAFSILLLKVGSSRRIKMQSFQYVLHYIICSDSLIAYLLKAKHTLLYVWFYNLHGYFIRYVHIKFIEEQSPYKSKHDRNLSRARSYPTGRGIAVDPEKSPGTITLSPEPNSVSHSVRKDTVQNGLTKSWIMMDRCEEECNRLYHRYW